MCRGIVKIFCFTCLVCLTACSLDIKDVELPSGFLQSATAYEVGGTNSIFDDKQLNFGPYRSVKINRGGVGETKSGLFIRKKTLKHRVSFIMVDDTGLRSNAEATGVFGEEDTSVLARWFGKEWWFSSPRKKYTNYIAGVIDVDGQGAYHLLIPDAYDGFGNRADQISGSLVLAEDEKKPEFLISTFNMDFEGGLWLQNTSAFMVEKQGLPIGYVQTSSPLKVWINNAASETDRFLAANVLGLLLLRKDLI